MTISFPILPHPMALLVTFARCPTASRATIRPRLNCFRMFTTACGLRGHSACHLWHRKYRLYYASLARHSASLLTNIGSQPRHRCLQSLSLRFFLSAQRRRRAGNRCSTWRVVKEELIYSSRQTPRLEFSGGRTSANPCRDGEKIVNWVMDGRIN